MIINKWLQWSSWHTQKGQDNIQHNFSVTVSASESNKT